MNHPDTFLLTDIAVYQQMHTEFSFSEGVSPEAQELSCAPDSLILAVPAKFYVPGESAGTTVYFAKELS